ncbi:hypothetical protein HY385_02480, partial [Candidatus Daviesbacteria bacterium]|nr:hypothetical protein [Candidatus Daviesbacteria bacterium]
MKINLLIGLGEVGKREAALKIKKQFSPDDITQLDLKITSDSDLKMAFSSNSLFGESDRLIILENVSDSLDLTKLPQIDSLTVLILASSPKENAKIITTAKKLGANIVSFEGEKELSAFSYLDNLIEQKSSALLELDKLLKEYGGMYVLAMVYYLLRRNLLPLPNSPFLQNKITSQKQKYSHDDWIKLYQLTLGTDFAIKNGVTTEELGLFQLTEKIISGQFGK